MKPPMPAGARRGKAIAFGTASLFPSPRLPSGRLRPSSTGYGEGRGEEPVPRLELEHVLPHPEFARYLRVVPVAFRCYAT